MKEEPSDLPPAAVPDAGAPQEPPHEFTLRKAFWVNHGCPFSALYGDDGEMQCNANDCRLDFKREPFAHLIALLMARGRLHAGICPKPEVGAPARAHQEEKEERRERRFVARRRGATTRRTGTTA